MTCTEIFQFFDVLASYIWLAILCSIYRAENMLNGDLWSLTNLVKQTLQQVQEMPMANDVP